MKFAEIIGIVVLLGAAVFVAQFAAKRIIQRASTIKEVVTSAPTSVEEYLDRWPNV